ncbi:MAG TPA: hypothetical protein VOA87_07440, partial [Thermoanaerobaculia bacterium]|nr:hypothetical protein [Thermoanaerobaculia bacterium]
EAARGRPAPARHAAARATRLAAGTDSAEVALFAALADGRAALADRRPLDAVRRLEEALARHLTHMPSPDLVFEARLLLGSARIAAGRANGACADLRSLETGAARGGYLFIAQQANRLAGVADCVRHG